MIVIKPLKTYDSAVAQRIRELLVELSRSGKDRGDIPRAWFEDIIASPSHDLLLAYQIPDEEAIKDAASTSGAETVAGNRSSSTEGRVVGMATLSLILGPGIRKNAYLEDFVTDSTCRGQGIGGQLWDAMLAWAREKGAARLEFTCGAGREAAQAFYEHHGAEKYATNFYRLEL